MSEGSPKCLPAGWSWTTIGETATEVRYGTSARAQETLEDGVPVLRMGNIVGGRIDFTTLKFLPADHAEFPTLLLSPGDLLFNRTNSAELVGKSAVYSGSPSPCSFASYLIRVRFEDGVQPTLVGWYLNSLFGRAWIKSVVSQQVGQANVNGTKLRACNLPLPPREEQRRIVEAIESYFSRLDDAVATLERVQRNLRRYRASVLKAAVEGRLVPTEAEVARQEGRDYEPASALLERILAERRRRWEEAELTKLEAKGKKPKDDKWKAKYKEPVAPDTEGLPDLPEGWCWATWSQVALSQNGRAFPSREYSDEGVRLLRPGNLYEDGTVGWTDKNTRMMPERWAREFPTYLVGGNEMVMNLTAQSLKDEFLGRVCMTAHGERCLLNQRLARLSPLLMSPRFVLWVLKSPWFRRFVDGLNTGSLIQHMFTSQLDVFAFPLPPLAEQQRLVAEIERRVTVGQKTAEQVATQAERASMVRQSILRWAFEGRLVDQDPSDEPASELFERIRAEREKAAATKKGATRGRRKAAAKKP